MHQYKDKAENEHAKEADYPKCKFFLRIHCPYLAGLRDWFVGWVITHFDIHPWPFVNGLNFFSTLNSVFDLDVVLDNFANLVR